MNKFYNNINKSGYFLCLSKSELTIDFEINKKYKYLVEKNYDIYGFFCDCVIIYRQEYVHYYPVKSNATEHDYVTPPWSTWWEDVNQHFIDLRIYREQKIAEILL